MGCPSPPVGPVRWTTSSLSWVAFGATAAKHALRPSAADVAGCRRRCGRERTDDACLPWDAGGSYGGWGGRDHHDTAPGVDRPPVVFVHGNCRDACDWRHHASYLRHRGFGGDELWAITFAERTPSHRAMVDQLDAFVAAVLDETGAPAVSVVAHSLGVTGVRYWLDRRDRYDRVETLVALAGPNHGTSVCADPVAGLVGEAVSGPCWFVDPARADDPSHPLGRLNEGTETPDDVTYYTVRGAYDRWYWRHPESPTLDGAAANVRLWTDHDGTRTSARTRRLLFEWLSG